MTEAELKSVEDRYTEKIEQLGTEVERLRESNRELVAALTELWAWLQGAQDIVPPDLGHRVKAALTKATEGRDVAAATDSKEAR